MSDGVTNPSMPLLTSVAAVSPRPLPAPAGTAAGTADQDVESFLKTECLDQFMDYVRSRNWAMGKTKHSQSYDCFLRAATLAVDPAAALAAVVLRVEAAGGFVDEYQVKRQQQRALAFVTQQPEDRITQRSKSPPPVFSPEVLARVAAPLAGVNPVEILRTCSTMSPAAVTSSMFLDSVFEPGENLLVFTNRRSQGDVLYRVGNAKNQALPELAPDGVYYLNQPVDGEYHLNAEGRWSRRSEPSVTAWRYLVLESDVAAADEWLRVVVQIPLPIVAIYTSGGRSIHCLVRVNAASKSEWDVYRDSIKPVVVPLGADPGALSAVRLTRLPGCWRGGKKQELLYINRQADGTPIIHLPDRPLSAEAEKK